MKRHQTPCNYGIRRDFGRLHTTRGDHHTYTYITYYNIYRLHESILMEIKRENR